MKFFDFKTAFVTGGAKGIGEAIVRGLVLKGVKVAFTYNKSQEKAMNLASELNYHETCVLPLKCNALFPEEISFAFQEAKKVFGEIDILVNNAGIAEQKLFYDITNEDWQNMISINLSSAFYFSREAVKDMIKHKRGRIINIASVWGECGASCEVHYSAAKAGLIGLTKALAKELAPSNISVNCVSPGAIQTDMLLPFTPAEINALCGEIPISRLGTTKEVADAVVFLAGNEASYITGQVLSVNGGLF